MTQNNDYVVQLQKLLAAIDWLLQSPTNKDGAIPADSKAFRNLIEVTDKVTKFLVGKS